MKHEVATRSTNVIVEILPPSPSLDTAGRINYYHRLSRQAGEIAIKGALAAGLELVKVQIEKPGHLFDEWVESNCEFGRRTAFKYMATVRATIINGGDINNLVMGSDEDRRNAIDEYAERTDSKSLTELYSDLGIVKKTPSNMGGRREGAGRKPKAQTEQTATDALAAIARDPDLAKAEADGVVSALYQFAVLRDGFGFLTESALAEVLQTLRDILAKGDEIARSRKAK